jgi:hypothetical protein
VIESKLTVAFPYIKPLGSLRKARQMKAGIAGAPKQMIQYTHRYSRNELGLAARKKTMYTLTAMAKDHQGSDCMNLSSDHTSVSWLEGTIYHGVHI